MIPRLILCLYILLALFSNVYRHFSFKSESVEAVHDFSSGVLLLNEYRFFSPSIADGYMVLLVDKTDPQYKVLPLRFASREMVNRIVNVYNDFYGNQEIRNLYAQSLTAHFANEYADSREINFLFFVYKLPGLGKLQPGSRPGMELAYTAEFEIER
jgi:hypothetical protein